MIFKHKINPTSQDKGTMQGLQHAMSIMQWQAKNDYYLYPVIDEIIGGSAHRIKFFNPDAHNGNKNIWSKSGESKNVYYYHSSNLKQHIADNNGVLIIAAGEKDLLTFINAGIYNVVSFLGEIRIPKTLAKDLHTLDVLRVLYYPDRDKTGRKSAEKIRDRLYGSGIHFEAKELPEAVGDKGDTYDLYKLLKFSNTAFRQVLDELPDLKLSPPKVKSKPVPISYDQQNQKLVDAMVARAQALGFKQNGNWLNGLSPLREETSVSFGFNMETGVGNDFTGITYAPAEVARALGIDPDSYKENRYTLSSGNNALKPKDQPLEQPGLWQNGVPDTWREVLLNYFHKSAAPFVEIVTQAIARGYLPETGFSQADIVEASKQLGQKLSQSTVSRCLDSSDPSSLFDVLYSELHIENIDTVTICKTEYRYEKRYKVNDKAHILDAIKERCKRRIYEQCNPVSGDKPIVAHVTSDMVEQAGVDKPKPTAIEINDTMGPVHKLQDNVQNKAMWRAKQMLDALMRSLDNPHSTPLPNGWQWKNGTLYRRAYAHATGRDNPQLSHREWANILGVSVRSVPAILEAANLKGINQFESVALSDDVDDVELSVRRTAKQVKGYPRAIVHLDDQGDIAHEEFYTPEAAQTALETGSNVAIKYQVANRYEVISEEPPQPRKRDPREKKSVEKVPQSEPEKQPEYDKGLPEVGNYHGPDYDPAWRFRQWVMMLERTTEYRFVRSRVIHVVTGEIIRDNPSEKDLIYLILGRELDND